MCDGNAPSFYWHDECYISILIRLTAGRSLLGNIEMKIMKSKSILMAVMAFSALAAVSSQGATIVLTNTGGLGALIDEVSSGTFAVPEISGLSVTIVSITSTGTGSGTLQLNSSGTSFGINSLGTTSDDASAFDAALSETTTISFNEEVQISKIDFVSFGASDVFMFAGQSIVSSDLSSSVFTFSTPLTIAANTSFSLSATAGTIGLESIDLTAIPEPSTALLGGIGLLALFRRRR